MHSVKECILLIHVSCIKKKGGGEQPTVNKVQDVGSILTLLVSMVGQVDNDNVDNSIDSGNFHGGVQGNTLVGVWSVSSGQGF
jgi:hypothetical protein